MKGMFFIEVIGGQLAAQGQICEEVGPGYHRLQFANLGFGRVVSAARLENMVLFNNVDEANEWLKKQQAGAEETPAPATEVPAPKGKNPRRPDPSEVN